MEAQIERAIQIAWNAQSSPEHKSDAFGYLTQLRADPRAWQVCATLFTRTPRASDVVRLVSLEIVNNAVQAQALEPTSLLFIKDTLLDYARRIYGQPEAADQIDPPHLQNKLAQTLTYLFAHLYLGGWETFITDFLALTTLPGSREGQRDNLLGVFIYLRTLSSIHDEIADVILVRQGNENKRNTDLKDAVRERDMRLVVQSWQEILAQYATVNDSVLDLTMKVLGKWVSWIDISLVITQDMLSLILPLIGRTKDQDGVRNAAIDAFNEVVGKKMKSADKTEMITFLNLAGIISELVASPPLNEFRQTHRYDTDLAEAVAKLINTVMADLVRVLEDRHAGNDTQAKAEQHVRDFLPLLLRFFGDEYDEVCSTVIPSLTDLLTFLRKVPSLPPSYRDMLPPILDAVVKKMRYDDTSQWGDSEDPTEEAEFQELRKRLQNLQKSVAAVDEELFVEVMSNLVANTLQKLAEQGDGMDWRDLDLALHELMLFGEFALPNQGVTPKSQPSSAAAQRLDAIMRTLVESRGVANFNHPAVLLQYMEICVRYCFFFEANPQYIPQVLENFVRLVHHDHPRLRVRSWYLFHRFVKHLRTQVGNVAETVIQSIGDLLPIKAVLPKEDASEDMSSDESEDSADAEFSGQLYLFEAIGFISSTQATPVEKQALYARSVMQPLFADMERHLPRAKSGDAQAVLQVHHVIIALGILAHGFSDQTRQGNQRQVPDKVVSAEFARAAEAILIALHEINNEREIRAACRSAFSRMLTVLGAALLPQLPQWIEGLLSRSSSKDEMAMFLRLLDQVVFGFKAEISDVLNQLLVPLMQRVFSGLEEPITGTDDEIQMFELRREYLSFLLVILDNNLAGVLVSDQNQSFFEPLVMSVIALAKSISHHGNMSASRLAFSVLGRLVAAWGGPDVANIAANPAPPSGSPAPLIPGFDSFMLTRIHPVCWEVLQDPQFNPKDAQTKQVLMEIAGLEQAIYTKTGEVFIRSLQQSLFQGLGGGDEEEFLRSLTTSTEKKQFGNYLMGLLARNRQ